MKRQHDVLDDRIDGCFIPLQIIFHLLSIFLSHIILVCTCVQDELRKASSLSDEL
jgi:hypothetical protein